MNQNNGNHNAVGVLDLVEDDTKQSQTTAAFYDSNDPVLKPAKEIDPTKKKSWKRKLVGWSFVLLLITGGAVALYLLLRVNRVNVRVQADSRSSTQNDKPKNESGTSENGLTAEAINIARVASGEDTARVSNMTLSPSPGSSATQSPSPSTNFGRDLSFTGNSPAFSQVNDTGSTNASSNSQPNTTSQMKNEASSVSEVQSHANTTQTFFVDDAPTRVLSTQAQNTSDQSRLGKKTAPTSVVKTPPAVLPPFGTMLPVRTQGVIFTLRNDSYARLELTRDSGGEGWTLPKGTLLIGRTTGSEETRAFVKVIGYIDSRDNKMVRMTGEVLGSDGATGIPGKPVGADRNRLKETLRKIASSGMQVAGTMAGALGRGTVVIDSAGYGGFDPFSDDRRRTASSGNDKKTFVKVAAGQAAYVMVADLPKSVQAVDAPGSDEMAQAAVSLTDREVMELILFGSPDEIRAAMSLMTDEQKRLAVKTMTPENKDK
ncbi:MAG TPA: hypothetical protein VE863_07290 [Pyrinomonadaceae bacterium]|jgi:hypothetical protein|nr:hypothetical protein [Pyrinomonadaceae bacterium]